MKSKTIIALMAVVFAAALPNCPMPAQGAPGEPAATPIIIDARTIDGKPAAAINNQTMTIDRAGAWLAQTAKEVGGGDPIIIRFAPDATFGQVVQLRQLVMKTHSNVRLVFDEQRSGSNPQELTFSDISPKLLETPSSRSK